MWRGVPLADLPALAADPVVQRLDEERWTALQGRIEADLHLGRDAEAATELRALTRDQPMREPLHAQLMLALYRDGRQTEALDVFRALGRTLADEAGLEPGADIRELRERILRNDPALRLRGNAPSSPTPAASAGSRNQLPADTRLFTGREQEMERLLALAREAAVDDRSGTLTISALDGLGGVGKSALAVRIAHRVRSLFPDGQLFIDLRGNTKYREPLTPLAALGQLLRSLDVPRQWIPAELAALLGYGVFLKEIGRFADSVRILEDADRIGEEIGSPIHDKARNALLRARAATAGAAQSAAPTPSDP